jgi:hypothetical protein
VANRGPSDLAFTKNGKPVSQPLPSRIVPGLRAWLTDRPADAPIFLAHRNTSLMIKADQKAAGIASDPFTLHSLGHTFASWIDQGGESTKDSMELVRHSDSHLTLGTYSHARLENLARVVEALSTAEMWASALSGDPPTPGCHDWIQTAEFPGEIEEIALCFRALPTPHPGNPSTRETAAMGR